MAALLLLLAACDRQAGLDRLAPGEQGRVAEVISGNTFTLGSGLQVRLAGVLAPRTDEPFGPQSQAALQAAVDGREVQLLYGGRRRDDYGRALAQVRLTRGHAWVQDKLLRAGAVRVRTWADNRALAEPMLEAEATARSAGRGLWGLAAYKVLIPGEVDRQTGFVIVEGRVRRLMGDPPSTLMFDNHVSAEVSASSTADFKLAGKGVEALRGRLLRVRGPVREGYDGPQLRLDHPEQVELLQDKD